MGLSLLSHPHSSVISLAVLATDTRELWPQLGPAALQAGWAGQQGAQPGLSSLGTGSMLDLSAWAFSQVLDDPCGSCVRTGIAPGAGSLSAGIFINPWVSGCFARWGLSRPQWDQGFFPPELSFSSWDCQ